MTPTQLTRIKDGPIIDVINAAWTAAHPVAGNLIVAGADDDLWQSYPHSGLAQIYAGSAVCADAGHPRPPLRPVLCRRLSR